MKREDGQHPIKTVGDLSKFSEPSASGWTRKLADLKGVGPGGADRIGEAETKFWKWWADGGATEFATERGLIGGNATEPGTGSGNPEAPASPTEPDDDATDDPDGTDLYPPPVTTADFNIPPAEVPQPQDGG